MFPWSSNILLYIVIHTYIYNLVNLFDFVYLLNRNVKYVLCAMVHDNKIDLIGIKPDNRNTFLDMINYIDYEKFKHL